MPSRRAVSASFPCVTSSVSRMAWRSRSASVGLSPLAPGRNTTSPSSSEPCFSVRVRPPKALSRSRRLSPRWGAPSPSASRVRRARWFAYRIRPYGSKTTTPSLNVSITACPSGAKPTGAGRLGVFSLAGIRPCIAEVARQGSRQHHISKTRGACGGHNSRTRLLATPAPPTPASTAASAAPCEALPFSPGQAAQLAAQVLQRIGPHRLALAPEHCEADRPVERGQIARLQPPCLAFLETQPHHADPLLHLVIHGHAVPVEVDRCRERIQGTALGFRHHLIYVELQPCVDELVPRADPRELGREPGGHLFRCCLRQPPARASPIGSEPLERASDPCLIQ